VGGLIGKKCEGSLGRSICEGLATRPEQRDNTMFELQLHVMLGTRCVSRHEYQLQLARIMIPD
jgi:hypothetical protein